MLNKLRNKRNRSDNMNNEQHLEFNAERLERREMLAGDVTVNVRGGDLVIRGDAAANQIQVSHSYFPSGYLITGTNGTTVNGQASFLATGANDDIRVNLKGGDDVFVLSNSSPDDLKFVGSHGNDVLILGNVIVRGNLKVSMGGGRDFIDIRDSTVVGSTRMRTSHGPSTINIAASQLRGDVRVTGGSSTDTFLLAEATSSRSFSAKFKGGNDTVRLANNSLGFTKLNGGHGLDTLSVFPNEPANFVKVSFEA